MALGTTYTFSQLYQIAVNAGFSPADATTMAAIGMAESGGNTNALNSSSIENSVGLWQINTQGNPTILQQLGLSDSSQLTDPNVNAKAAYLLYSTSGFSPWSVYNSGIYANYLPSASIVPINPTYDIGQTLANLFGSGSSTSDVPTYDSSGNIVIPVEGDTLGGMGISGIALIGIVAVVGMMMFRK